MLTPSELISLAGLAGTVVAVFIGLRLAAGRNADTLRTLADRIAGMERTVLDCHKHAEELRERSHATYASRDLVENQFQAMDRRLSRIEGSLDRIESSNGCHYPNCPPGFERNRAATQGGA